MKSKHDIKQGVATTGGVGDVQQFQFQISEILSRINMKNKHDSQQGSSH